MPVLYVANSGRHHTFHHHHNGYPTGNYSYYRSINTGVTSQCETPQYVNLTEDVRVELSYARRVFGRGGSGGVVLGDSLYRPHAEEVVAPSYQQIAGVGCERGREWTGRPIFEDSTAAEWIRAVGVGAMALAFILLVFIVLKTYSVLMLFVLSLLTAAAMLVLFAVLRWRRRRQLLGTPAAEEQVRRDMQTGSPLTEVMRVTKKQLSSDSPPPYEDPPDYHSLPPELLMDARCLEGLCQQEAEADEASLHNQLIHDNVKINMADSLAVQEQCVISRSDGHLSYNTELSKDNSLAQHLSDST